MDYKSSEILDKISLFQFLKSKYYIIEFIKILLDKE
jgi:hypothetical protein